MESWRTIGEERLSEIGFGIWPRHVVDFEARSVAMREASERKGKRVSADVTCISCGLMYKAAGITRHRQKAHGG